MGFQIKRDSQAGWDIDNRSVNSRSELRWDHTGARGSREGASDPEVVKVFPGGDIKGKT